MHKSYISYIRNEIIKEKNFRLKENIMCGKQGQFVNL